MPNLYKEKKLFDFETPFKSHSYRLTLRANNQKEKTMIHSGIGWKQTELNRIIKIQMVVVVW